MNQTSIPETLSDHTLAPTSGEPTVLYEKKPARTSDGEVVEGLYNAWITLNNPEQYNSYTTDMVKDVILSFGKASTERDVVCVVFTGAGDKAFCSGGNTKEYAEYYAGRPLEYRQYMRLFNDMVSSILGCDKPVICRVNGMRIGGGQEIGMACDISLTQDLARFGQAGPKHGSAPIGGATDFLPLILGMEQAIVSGTLCEPWSAHKAYRLNMVTDIAPALKVDDEYIANPLVETGRYLDQYGKIIHGEAKTGEDLQAGKALLKKGEVDLSLLDQMVDDYCAKFVTTFPDCVTKSLEELRKPKINVWNMNKEASRAWLALNMNTEAQAGFRAFNEPAGKDREIDFIALRKALAAGAPWTQELTESLLPMNRTKS